MPTPFETCDCFQEGEYGFHHAGCTHGADLSDYPGGSFTYAAVLRNEALKQKDLRIKAFKSLAMKNARAEQEKITADKTAYALREQRQSFQDLIEEDERLPPVTDAALSWFGPPWGAALCKTTPPTPRPHCWCFHCDVRLKDGDSGIVVRMNRGDDRQHRGFHRACFPAWIQARKLPLDMRAVVGAVFREAAQKVADRSNDDRRATAAFVAERDRGYELGDSWETPSWED